MKKKQLNESGFARVRSMMMGMVPSVETIGIMTAENPNAEKFGAKQNKQFNKSLMSQLRQMNYGPIPIGGSFGHKESSFLIPNITRAELADLGKKFEQEAVIWASKQSGPDGEFMRWEYMEGDATVQTRDVSMGGSDVQDRDDYYSEKKGRKFIIPFFDPEYEDAKQTKGGRGVDKQIPPTDDEVPDNERAKQLAESLKRRAKLCTDVSRTPRSRWHHRGLMMVELKMLRRLMGED
tara:strand:+ start:5546 stop:6253 length:708 start_codon:yes stop_codon:yes gene_type:complete